MRIPLSAPDISEADVEAVSSVLRTPWLSRGPRLAEFERALAAKVGTAHGIGVSSGTAGLHLCVRASGLGAGDEVITSPFSFVASANAILYERATPVFVDVDAHSLNLDPQQIEPALTPRTRAILVVHVFGRPAPMPAILDIARRRGLIVIEDACEALGAQLDARHAGSFGTCGVFAFYPNKQITTGEGGMIVSDDPQLARLCRSLRNHGRDDEGAEPARLGYNYRLAEMASALGNAQLARLDATLARRDVLARRYARQLAARPEIVVPPCELAGSRVSWFVYVVRLAGGFGREDRDWIAAELQRRGIGCARYFAPLHLQPHLQAALGHQAGDFPVTEAASERTLALPFFNRMTEDQVDEVCATLLDLVARRRG